MAPEESPLQVRSVIVLLIFSPKAGPVTLIFFVLVQPLSSVTMTL